MISFYIASILYYVYPFNYILTGLYEGAIYFGALGPLIILFLLGSCFFAFYMVLFVLLSKMMLRSQAATQRWSDMESDNDSRYYTTNHIKTSLFSSIRLKVVGYFIISSVLTIMMMIVLTLLATFVQRNYIYPFNLLIDFVYYGSLIFGNAGPIIVLFLVGAALTIVFFLILSRKIIRDFEQVSDSLEMIANGNLNYRVPVRTDDEIGALATNINHMTEKLQKSIEEERQAERTKHALITNVSHDLRTPLTSIIGYLELIEDDRYRDEVELRHYTQIAYTKAQRLQKLIEDLFEYTKLHSGGVNIYFSQIDIGQLLNQLVTEYVPIMKEAGVVCRMSPATEKIYVQADGTMLVRVFENLLSNAIQYGKEGQFVDVHWKISQNEVVIEVISYGQPIPEQDLPHIFERFYRVDKSRAEHEGGSGLGLAIAKNIIELHGGKISAYSNEQRTIFDVRLKIDESM